MPSLPLHFLATPQMSNCKATLLISNTSHALTFALATLRHFSILHIHHPSTHMHAMHPISLQYFETWSLVDTTPSIHICKCKHIRLRNVKKTAAYWEVSFLGGGSGRSIELFEIVHWALLMLGQGQFREYITGKTENFSFLVMGTVQVRWCYQAGKRQTGRFIPGLESSDY